MDNKQLKSIGLILLGSISLIGLILLNTKLDIAQIEISEVQEKPQETVITSPPETAWEETSGPSSSTETSSPR